MKFLFNSSVLLGLSCLLIVSGCSSKLPRTVSLEEPAQKLAIKRLDNFLHESCVEAIDSDVRIGWQAYGRKALYAATLLTASPSFIRFAAVDPLNRPLYLLVSTGKEFTFADNLHSEGFTGEVGTEYFKKFLPQGISVDELFLWLGGRVSADNLHLLSVKKAEDGQLNWYEIEYGDSFRHLLGLDQHHLQRHLVIDTDNNVVLDVLYAEFTDTPKDCDWPGIVKVNGKELAASLSLEVKKIYSYSLPNKKIFHLQLPSHYTVHEVQ